ncbi:glycosyltransferase [Paracoccus nototheniae]|uniref:glycosyltransferase n=1 Tax=Paracoccus nototheniae TaxID=2489002 RepID=UPI00103B4571|nr:glycosyltransferase [Paracoccus nototheniae]
MTGTTAPIGKRIVIVSHSHPALRYGGGEVAAYRQFQHLLEGGEDAYFLGSTIGPEDEARFFGPGQQMLSFSDRDFCMRGTGMDSFPMEHPRIADEDRVLDILTALQGDIYHFHHFWNIGAGTIRRLRARFPDAQMICTLHEMTAICANHGQMVKTSGELCYAASDVACAACLGRPPVDFALRRTRMAEMLDLFDTLLSPSQFLADRFAVWGIPPDRIGVIENGLDHTDPPPPVTETALLARSRRFAFFGQATPTKGLDVLVRAALLIEAGAKLALAAGRPTAPIALDVYGVTAEAFARLWPALDIPVWMRFRGRYRPQDCVAIMRGFGWIVIPSVWWENSPVVIQEARAAGTPMIASDIGGMAEKTAGWGRQFRAGDADALAAEIMAVHDRPDLLAQHIALIEPPLDLAGFTKGWRDLCGL